MAMKTNKQLNLKYKKVNIYGGHSDDRKAKQSEAWDIIVAMAFNNIKDRLLDNEDAKATELVITMAHRQILKRLVSELPAGDKDEGREADDGDDTISQAVQEIKAKLNNPSKGRGDKATPPGDG